jgi:hypothetical protein
MAEPPELPEVTAGSEDGFVDLTLRLERIFTDDDGAFHLQASGRHRGQLVGFAALLGPEWTKQPLDNALQQIYWGEVIIESVGEASDRFLSAMNEAYGTQLGPRRMRPETRFLAAGLDHDPRELPSAKTHIKLFFEHQDEEQCAELYLNVDVMHAIVEVREKDTDYRVPLVRCLSAAGSA